VREFRERVGVREILWGQGGEGRFWKDGLLAAILIGCKSQEDWYVKDDV
jgi:hypothetical protein